MNLLPRLLNQTNRFLPSIDLRSLRVRLTLGIATVSTLGMGSVALWTSWKMQQILVSTNKQNIVYVAERLEHEVEIYSQMTYHQAAIQKAINNLSGENLWIWFRGRNGKVTAQSLREADSHFDTLKNLPKIPLKPEVERVNGRYWVLCGAPLQAQGKTLGKIYLAQNITKDQVMLLNVIPSLLIATLISLVIMTVIIAVYIQRSLQPLKYISRTTQAISADRLVDAQIQVEDSAPTEVRELAQTFDQMLVRLNEGWENQRQFVSNVSHELRTPLTVVSGYLQSILRRENNLTEPQREALQIASSEADSTIQLLQELLELARADSGHLRLQMEPVVINHLAEEVIGMAKQYSNRQIHFEANHGKIQVKTDRNRLKQVLINLVDNAIKYSPDDQPVMVKLSQQGEQVKIEVCDRGIGIPLADQARIFERFYRVDEARSRSTGGTGLGLSIVKTLVEGMGGTVHVRSNQQQGSTFTVTLPTTAHN